MFDTPGWMLNNLPLLLARRPRVRCERYRGIDPQKRAKNKARRQAIKKARRCG